MSLPIRDEAMMAYDSGVVTLHSPSRFACPRRLTA